MIGVIAKPGQAEVVGEFFELFKTPWEFYRPGRTYDVLIVTTDEIPQVNAKLLLICGSGEKRMDARLGIAARDRQRNSVLSYRGTPLPLYGDLLTFWEGTHRTHCATDRSEIAVVGIGDSNSTVIRLGYDLFDEVRLLLSVGQPVEHAGVPTLEIHIQMLREWILDAGIPLLEIPPSPASYPFMVCLTHDIDFVGIRRHKFDHTMWGFVFRATVGALRNLVRGRLAVAQLIKSFLAVASLPLVFMGWVKDFWEPFEWYLQVEEGLPATYFLIPFKRRPGEKVPGRDAARRATAYDIGDLPTWAKLLQERGCELGTHGIDAWHSPEKGRAELAATTSVTGESSTGIRMHWLLHDKDTPSVLEQAGYSYDSTCGYNETIGYRTGTSQAYRPAGVQTLLELPMHIQDGALFYPGRLDLTEPDAERRCQALIDNARKFGGVLTVLWHDRSHGPERFWGHFYVGLLETLKSLDAWFGTAAQVVGWFRKRRQVKFEQVEDITGLNTRLHYEGEEIQPPLKVRLYGLAHRRKESMGEVTAEFVDISWNGKSLNELDSRAAARLSVIFPEATPSFPS